MIRVALAGYAGRMGQAVVKAIAATDDIEIACGIDPLLKPADFSVYASIEDAIFKNDFDVLVDFTRPDVVADTLKKALQAGIDCVVGTTGLDRDTLEALADKASGGACLFYAPNFTTGAVLMMQFARAAAPYFPDAEIIEFHHAQKKDAPSGTAILTAQLIASAKEEKNTALGRECELEGCQGARGAQVSDIPVHAVRSSGYVASQEVIFGSLGQSLTIRHDSWDRDSYMPGVLLGIRSVGAQHGLVVGLENFMEVGTDG